MATYTYHCLHCNRDFESRSDCPTRCPMCDSVTWDMPPRKAANLHMNTPTKRVGRGDNITARAFGGRPRQTRSFRE